MSALESFTIGGVEMNDGVTFDLESFDVPPPRKKYEWAAGADSSGEALIRDPEFENRQIALRVRVVQQASMDDALAKLGTIVGLLEEAERQPDGLACVWTPADATASLTVYALSGEVDGVPVVVAGDDAGWFIKRPVVTFHLVCKPFLYGAEVTTATTTAAASPFVTLTVAGVPGDVPAEARLIVTDAAAQGRRYVEWGLEQRHYNAATSLLIDSDAMVTTDFAATGATRTGARDANATGNNVVRATLVTTPTAVAGTGNLAHVGTFRVKARIYATSSDVRVALAWQAGDGGFSTNAAAVPTAVDAFCEIDLGVISIPPARLGSQQWTGRIEAFSTRSDGTSDTVDIDDLVLVPAGEGYGKAVGRYARRTGALIAYDEFTSTTAGGALSGRTAPLGGAWTTSGAATDFVFSDFDGGESIVRSASSDTGIGRLALLGTSSPSNVDVSALMRWAGGTRGWQQVVARYVDNSNFLQARLSSSGHLYVYITIAGTRTTLVSDTTTVYYGSNVTLGVTLTVYSSGYAVAALVDAGGNVLKMVRGYHAALATGGALASGRFGILDYGGSDASGHSRYYDNFVAAVPAPESVVMHASQSLEIRHDGQALREDAAGTVYGAVPYRGSRFMLPPAGSANRTARVLVKAHRNDVESAADTADSDSTSVQVAYTPRYLEPR